MKVLLCKPPLTLQKDFNGIARFYPPIGLGYIASSLKKEGYEVKILDTGIEKWNKINERGNGVKYLGMNFDDITELVKREKPDIVGISILTVEAINASLVAKAVKKANENIKVIAGGPHVCVRPEETIVDPNIDLIVIGEGEVTTAELVNALENDKPLQDVRGIWYKTVNRVFKNELRPPIKDLDELPFPAWDLMNMEKYFKALKYLQGGRSLKEREMGIITSRGCPYACVFCSIRLSMGRSFRPRSPKNVLSEIEYLVNKYDIKHIGFEDDNLIFDKKRMNTICDMLIEKGLDEKITWDTPNGVRADTLNEELLIKMKRAGCTEIIVAPESGSQYVVNNIIGKNLDLKTVEDVVGICKKVGIDCGCYFVVGIPGETIEQLEETVKFANKMRTLGAKPYCCIAWPYYGTNLYNIAREKGYLLKKDGEELELGLLNLEAMIKTPEFTPEQIYKYQRMVHGESEMNTFFGLILKSPLNALRAFSLHPTFITKYLLKKYVLRMNK
jgi:magnesium-protoporphyrin IX monomethyl ester (oxidative) cyclase